MAQWIKSLRASLSPDHLYRPIGGLPDHKRKAGDVDEEKTLLADDEIVVSAEPDASHPRVFVILSCILNVILLFLLILRITHTQVKDPTLQVWSPANTAVEYEKKTFDARFFTSSDYMGVPTNKTDALWEDLYDFGNSIISEEEAARLPHPTLNIPGTKDYLIQLDVFHQLHCLNDLRKAIWPERYPHMWRIEDGHINRNWTGWWHWEHCIDALRQTLMCHADVSPNSWHVNVPMSNGIFSRIATTHTCRNFAKIQEWGRQHETSFGGAVPQNEVDRILENPPFDQTPWEDLESVWWKFPGNKFFKQWRDA